MCGSPGSGKTIVAEYIKKLCTDKKVVYIDQDMFQGNLIKFTQNINKLFSDPNVDILINCKTNINVKARKNMPIPSGKSWKIIGVNLHSGSNGTVSEVDELLNRIINRTTMSTVTPTTYSIEDIKKIIINFLSRYQTITAREKQFDSVLNLACDTPVLLKAIQVCKKLHCSSYTS